MNRLNKRLMRNKKGALDVTLGMLILLVFALIAIVVGFLISGQSTNLLSQLRGTSDTQIEAIETSIAKDDPEILFEKGVEFFRKGIADDDRGAFRNSYNFLTQFLDLTKKDSSYEFDRGIAEYYLAIDSYYLGRPNMVTLLQDNTGKENFEDSGKFGSYGKFYEPVSKGYLILGYAKFLNWKAVSEVYEDKTFNYNEVKDDFITFLQKLPSDSKLKEYDKVHVNVVQSIMRSYIELEDKEKAQAFYNKYKSDIDRNSDLKGKYNDLLKKRG